MTTIEFYRFVLDTDNQKVLPTISLKTYKVDYIETLYHTTILKDSDCPIERARNVAHKFLKDHYGFVVITLSNQDEFDHPIRIKLCNHRKFCRDMISNGVLVNKQKRFSDPLSQSF